MFSAFYSTRSITLFLVVALYLVHGQTISQLKSLENMRTGLSQGLNLDLYSMIRGPNLTFSISGSYTPPFPASDVKIYQNLNLPFSYKKPTKSGQLQSYSSLQIDYSRKLLYTVDSPNVNVWDLSLFPDLSQVLSYPVKVNSGYQVVSLQLINFRMYPGKPLQRLAFTVDFKSNTYYTRVINFTDLNNVTEIIDLQRTKVYQDYNRVSFYQDTNYVWAFYYSQSVVYVVRFNMVGDLSSQDMYTIDASTFDVPDLSPVSISFYSKKGYFCDTFLGVYQLSIDFINSTSANFPITQKLFAPSTLGDIVSCTINQGILTVDTDGGTALYTLPSLEQLILFPQYTNDADQDNYGMISNSDYTVGWINTLNTQKTSLRVYSSNTNFLDSLVIDLDVNYILKGDTDNIDPSFTLYKPVSGENTFIIINAANNLFVYEIENGSYLYFPPQSQAYTYQGTLTAYDGFSSVAYPVSLQGIDDNSTKIFTGRGNYDGQGYPAPTIYSSYVLSTNASVYTTYVPLSNYFSGPNITYSLEISKGLKNLDLLAVYTPSKTEQISNIPLTTSSGDFNYFQVFPVSIGTDIVVMLNGNTLSVFLYVNLGLKTETPYVFSDSVTPSLVSVYNLDKYYIVVECTGINSDNVYFTQWNVFSYSAKSNAFSLLGQTTMLNRDPSSKILLTDADLFYSLAGNSLDVFTLNSFTGVMTYKYSIDDTVLSPSFDFTPVTFAVFDKLYVFDYYQGLMYIESLNGTTEFTAITSNLTFPSSYDVTLQSDQTAIYLTNTGFNYSTIYVIPFALDTYEVLPNINCQQPTSLSLSQEFYSQVCTTGGNFFIQIFDAYAETYTALYSEVAPGSVGIFALGSLFGYKAETGYFSDGTKILGYSIGQVGNSSFNPTFPYDVTPPSDQSQVVWSQVTLTFNDLYYSSEYDFVLTLKASNYFGSSSVKLNFSLLNSRNYINQNPNYDTSSSNFTSTGILLKADFEGPIPLGAFNGNNLSYGFLINNTQENLVSESSQCADSPSQFCVESKTYSLFSQAGNFTYFDTWSTNIVATNSTHILIYSYIQSNSLTLTKSILSNSISENTTCYQVEYLESFNGFAMACSSIKSTGSNYFIVILDENLLVLSELYNISYPVVFLTSSYDSGTTWVYFYQTTDITILQVSTIDSNFILIAHINQNSLFANTPQFSFSASSFKPVDIYYYSSRVLILIDQNLGIVFIEPTNYDLPYRYRLGYVLTPTTDIIQVQNSRIVSSAYDSSGQGTILLVMNTGDVYKCAVYPYPRQQVHFPKISENSYVPLNKKPTLLAEYNILIFPIALGTTGYLRFLNYSSDPVSAIFRQDVYGKNDNNTYNQRVLVLKWTSDIYIHNFSPVNILNAGGPLVFNSIRAAPKGYIKKVHPQFNGTISLFGYINENSTQLDSVAYSYPYSGSSGGSDSNPLDAHTYRSSWNRWYFWFIFGIFALALVASIISIYLCISRRKNRSYSHMSIGLTTVNP